MLIRKLRQKLDLSQEQLAEKTSLSLRTIQRVEAGHRISYSSLRALATAFQINVDNLERELYAMNTPSNEYIEMPLWARLILNLPSISRLNHSALKRHEISLVVYAFFAYAASFIVPRVEFSFVKLTTIDALYFSAFCSLFLAYIVSITHRTREKYEINSSTIN